MLKSDVVLLLVLIAHKITFWLPLLYFYSINPFLTENEILTLVFSKDRTLLPYSPFPQNYANKYTCIRQLPVPSLEHIQKIMYDAEVAISTNLQRQKNNHSHNKHTRKLYQTSTMTAL